MEKTSRVLTETAKTLGAAIRLIESLEIPKQKNTYFPPIITINGKELSPDEYEIKGRTITIHPKKSGCS